MMVTKAVLFDFGETLWHFPKMPPIEKIRGETVHRISNLLRSWGIEPAGELFFLGRDIRMAADRATDEAYWGDLVSPKYHEIAGQVAADKGLDLSEERTIELWRTWNLGGPFLGRELHPGACETLEWLKERNFRIGAVTNRGLGDEPFRDELRALGIIDYFEVMSVSCEVGYMKPHPRIFQHALEGLRIEPQEAVMVGDSPRADVWGARALGMTTVLKRNTASEAERELEKDQGEPEETASEQEYVEPDFIIDQLLELTTLPILNKI